ncbi:hypothetical protein MNBD_GAMMA13-39 [hydrothermal vent metagenome]|uniref:Rhodanese domain-containing protein n=1 Tax=hydrothermal vent metagenome TaxID=652676 RepID=A0A3B0YKU6_9ZZZZ
MVVHTRRVWQSWLAAMFILVCQVKSGAALASAPPESIPGVKTVTAEQLIELAGSKPDLVVIDARMSGDLKNGFIEGSVNLPDIDTNCESLAGIISKKDVPSLFYCNGVKCGRSAKAVKVAHSCGYQNLYWFRGGFEEWSEKGYPYFRQ